MLAACRPQRTPHQTRERPNVVILRGHQANPWELRPWLEPGLSEHYAVSMLRGRP